VPADDSDDISEMVPTRKAEGIDAGDTVEASLLIELE